MPWKKKQLEHLEKRLLDERARARKALGLFDQRTQADRDSSDSDMSAYTDHMADQGTEAQEEEHAEAPSITRGLNIPELGSSKCNRDGRESHHCDRDLGESL